MGSRTIQQVTELPSMCKVTVHTILICIKPGSFDATKFIIYTPALGGCCIDREGGVVG